MSKKTLFLKARKSLTYGTRHMEAGDVFDMPAQEALRYLARRKVYLAKKLQKPDVGPAGLHVGEWGPEIFVPNVPGNVIPNDELAELRAVYESAAGKAPDGRWGVARLQEEIAFLSKDED